MSTHDASVDLLDHPELAGPDDALVLASVERLRALADSPVPAASPLLAAFLAGHHQLATGHAPGGKAAQVAGTAGTPSPVGARVLPRGKIWTGPRKVGALSRIASLGMGLKLAIAASGVTMAMAATSAFTDLPVVPDLGDGPAAASDSEGGSADDGATPVRVSKPTPRHDSSIGAGSADSGDDSADDQADDQTDDQADDASDGGHEAKHRKRRHGSTGVAPRSSGSDDSSEHSSGTHRSRHRGGEDSSSHSGRRHGGEDSRESGRHGGSDDSDDSDEDDHEDEHGSEDESEDD